MLGTSIFILLIFGSAAGIDLPGIIRKKQWLELTVYMVIFILGLFIVFMHEVFQFDFAVITDWFLSIYVSPVYPG